MSIKVKPDNLGIKIKRVTRAFQKYFVFIVWSIFSLKMHACKNNKIVQSLEVVPLTLPSCPIPFHRYRVFHIKQDKRKRCISASRSAKSILKTVSKRKLQTIFEWYRLLLVMVNIYPQQNHEKMPFFSKKRKFLSQYKVFPWIFHAIYRYRW